MKKVITTVLLAFIVVVGLSLQICTAQENSNVQQVRNMASSLHDPEFKEWHLNTLWVYCKPKQNVGDPPIVYYDPSVEIVTISASLANPLGGSARFAYCITFKNSNGDHETFVLDPGPRVTSLRLMKMERVTLTALSERAGVTRRN